LRGTTTRRATARSTTLPAWRLLSLEKLPMEMRSADQGLAALLEHALLDLLAVLIGAGIDLAGDLQPDKVANLLLRDLLLNKRFPSSRVGLKEFDCVNRPAIISLLSSREGLAVLWRVP